MREWFVFIWNNKKSLFLLLLLYAFISQTQQFHSPLLFIAIDDGSAWFLFDLKEMWQQQTIKTKLSCRNSCWFFVCLFFLLSRQFASFQLDCAEKVLHTLIVKNVEWLTMNRIYTYRLEKETLLVNYSHCHLELKQTRHIAKVLFVHFFCTLFDFE